MLCNWTHPPTKTNKWKKICRPEKVWIRKASYFITQQKAFFPHSTWPSLQTPPARPPKQNHASTEMYIHTPAHRSCVSGFFWLCHLVALLRTDAVLFCLAHARYSARQSVLPPHQEGGGDGEILRSFVQFEPLTSLGCGISVWLYWDTSGD